MTQFLNDHGVLIALICAAAAVVYGVVTSQSLLRLSPGNEKMREISLAIQEDQELFNYAWDNKVVIVSPSTLLATLRTIASIWKQENQTKNALEIASLGASLYDKFVNFVQDLEKVGKGIETAQSNYSNALNKLHTGKGNLVRTSEKLKDLGIKTQKALPDYLIEDDQPAKSHEEGSVLFEE